MRIQSMLLSSKFPPSPELVPHILKRQCNKTKQSNILSQYSLHPPVPYPPLNLSGSRIFLCRLFGPQY